MSSKVVLILSGGMDSTVLAYELAAARMDVHAVSFDYGQRHGRELGYARATALRLGFLHDVIDLSGITKLLATSGSSLVSSTEVPDGHYAEETMKATVVPNRNMMMISIAAAVAVAEERSTVFIGVHAGDHFIYPDCRTEFIIHASEAVRKGNEGFGAKTGTIVQAPYVNSTKADIAANGFLLGVPFESTWSCYKGGRHHCGRCGTCVERLEALDEGYRRVKANGNRAAADATVYEDKEFWATAVSK